MHKTLWIAAIFMAFAAGYGLRGVTAQAPFENKLPLQSMANNAAHSLVANAVVANDTSPQSAKKQKTISSAASATGVAASSTSWQDSAQMERSAVASQAEPPAAAQYPNEISDEEVDRAVPAPYNDFLKNTHGILREKYQPFLESNKQDAWDITMQNKITDFMLGNAYSKFITVDSIACRTNFCEIRAIELKQGAIGMIFAEMFMQDWWDTGAGQFTTNEFTDSAAMYGLLIRK